MNIFKRIKHVWSVVFTPGRRIQSLTFILIGSLVAFVPIAIPIFLLNRHYGRNVPVRMVFPLMIWSSLVIIVWWQKILDWLWFSFWNKPTDVTKD